MKILEPLFSLFSKSHVSKWVLITLIVVSFIGFYDATYLTAKHYTGGSVNCNLVDGCEKVLSSEYSTIFGVPVALGGMLFYLFVFLTSLIYLDSKNHKWLYLIPPATVVGLLASGYFVYLQIYVIESICQYCMLSAITSSILFVTAMVLLKQLRRESRPF